MPNTEPKWELREGALCTIGELGEVLRVHKPIGTSIAQILPKGQYVILREDYYNFPTGVSNVYCLDAQLQRIWAAELPSNDDVYANALVDGPQGIRCASWQGFTCTLDPNTGKIVSKEFTK